MAPATGSCSDLEAPLLTSEQPHGKTPSESQRNRNDGPKRPWKDRPIEPMHSGRWQFKYHKYVEKADFPEDSGSSKGIKEYNKRQREALAGFEEVDAINRGKDLGGPEPEDASVSRAINLSNGLNVFLLIVKVYASVQSGSLAIMASTLDSLLDTIAGAILWFSHYYMQKKNRYKYPIGKLRIQPVGIVVFAATMATLGLQVLMSGVNELLSGGKEPMDNRQRIWLTVIMGLAVAVKLGLYLYCRSFENDIVRVYAMDHFFDVVTNLVGLAAALLGAYFFWWIDPAGACFLALYTIGNWTKTLIENALSLVGKAAPPEAIQKFTYMAFNHDQRIQRIDTVRAYTFGSFYFVEVDIELPPNMLLKDAHEIGEGLQDKLERLPEVERAFVHLDYECEHRPEHSAAESKH